MKKILVNTFACMFVLAGCAPVPATPATTQPINRSSETSVVVKPTQPTTQTTKTTEPTTRVPPKTTTPTAPTKPTTPAQPATPITKTVTITSGGFSPAAVTLKVGDKVVFVNNDETVHWPASDNHPSHTLCPGFDAGRPLKKGDSFSFTFKEAKTCGYHDHLKISLRGSVTVK